jgi:hypothetical protein
MWHTVIVTATEWDNFFALRCNPAAQPEMQETASAMREAMWASNPVELDHTGWHCPGVSQSDMALPLDKDIFTDKLVWPLVSAGRMAKVSYLTHGNPENPNESYRRARNLTSNGHWSPLEHPATPFSGEDWQWVDEQKVAILNETPDAPESVLDRCEFIGNFRGWKQLRKFFPNEENFARLETED